MLLLIVIGLFIVLEAVTTNSDTCSANPNHRICYDTVEEDGSNHCLVLCDGKASWREAAERCEKNHGTLAVDDSNIQYQRILNLIQKTNNDPVWLGGINGPRLWNWADGHSTPLYYQGCYASTDGSKQAVEMNEDGESIGIGDAATCRLKCKDNGFRFFSLKDKPGGIFCYCGNYFGKYGMSASCSVCLDGHFCGNEDCSAVYTVQASTDVLHLDHKRDVEYPGCIMGTHLRGNRTNLTLADCGSARIAICMSETPCRSGEYQGSKNCFIILSTPKTWTEALKSCYYYDKSRNSQPLTFGHAEDEFVKDVDTAMQTLSRTRRVLFWTGGSNLMWYWLKGKEVTDILKRRWHENEQHYPLPGHCMSMNGQGRWISRDCLQNQYRFICELVNKQTETTPEETTVYTDMDNTTESGRAGRPIPTGNDMKDIVVYLVIGAACLVLLISAVVISIICYFYSRRQRRVMDQPPKSTEGSVDGSVGAQTPPPPYDYDYPSPAQWQEMAPPVWNATNNRFPKGIPADALSELQNGQRGPVSVVTRTSRHPTNQRPVNMMMPFGGAPGGIYYTPLGVAAGYDRDDDSSISPGDSVSQVYYNTRPERYNSNYVYDEAFSN